MKRKSRKSTWGVIGKGRSKSSYGADYASVTALRNSELCSVQRVVPGKLLYVESESRPNSTYSFKLDKLRVLRRDGSLTPYRGEPLSTLRVGIGEKVRVVDINSPSASEVIIAEKSGSIAMEDMRTSIGEVASSFARGLKFWS